MSMILNRLTYAFQLTFELAESLPEIALTYTLPNLPSNTMGEQFWCIIGARESYLRAIQNGVWCGFACSLNQTTSKADVLEHLHISGENCLKHLASMAFSEEQESFLFSLLEHEIQHHGQWIRYMYGNHMPFPNSWKNRYAL